MFQSVPQKVCIISLETVNMTQPGVLLCLMLLRSPHCPPPQHFFASHKQAVSLDLQSIKRVSYCHLHLQKGKAWSEFCNLYILPRLQRFKYLISQLTPSFIVSHISYLCKKTGFIPQNLLKYLAPHSSHFLASSSHCTSSSPIHILWGGGTRHWTGNSYSLQRVTGNPASHSVKWVERKKEEKKNLGSHSNSSSPPRQATFTLFPRLAKSMCKPHPLTSRYV